MRYTENRGQWDDRVLFKSHVSGATLFVQYDGLMFVMSHPEDIMAAHQFHINGMSLDDLLIRKHSFKMEFIDCNKVVPYGKDFDSSYENYFVGQNPENWVSKIHPCKQVIYPNIWDHIDLHLLGSGSSLKYEFVVHPGGDYNDIQWRIMGVDDLTLSDENELIYQTSVGSLIDKAPISFQWIDGKLSDIPTSYLNTDLSTKFKVETYDTTRDLIIDPFLVAATLVGATGAQELWGYCSSYGQNGDIYSATMPSVDNFPATLGAFAETGSGFNDLGIVRFNSDGSQLLWATYLAGSSTEVPHKLWIEPGGDVYLLAHTLSDDFPVTIGVVGPNYLGLSDIAIVRLSPDGSDLIASTYFGGAFGDGVIFTPEIGVGNSNNDLGEITIDSDGNPLIAFSSLSIDYPHQTIGDSNFSLQWVIAKLSPELDELIWCTAINGSGADQLSDLKILDNGNILLVGNSNSEDLPIQSNVYQNTPSGYFEGCMFILNENADQILFSTWYGKPGYDICYYCDEDLEGNIWVCGMAPGGMPIVGEVYDNDQGYTYISCFTSDLQNVLYSSNIGTIDIENGVVFPTAFMVDYCGKTYLAGHKGDLSDGNFVGLEISSEALTDEGALYLCAFEQNLSSLSYGTYLAGNHTDGGENRFDKKGVVYHSICSCPDPYGLVDPAPWAYSTEQVAGCEAFAFKIDFESPSVVSALSYETQSKCLPFDVIFHNWSDQGTSFWNFGDDAVFIQNEDSTVYHTYTQSGDFMVQLITIDSTSCNITDTMTTLIHVPEQTSDLTLDFESVLIDPCTEFPSISALFSGSFSDSIWWNVNGQIIGTGSSLEYNFEGPGEYLLEVFAVDSSCQYQLSESELIHLGPPVVANANISEPPSFCAPVEIDLSFSGSNADSIAWYENNEWSGSMEQLSIYYSDTNESNFSLIAWNDSSCNQADTFFVSINVFPPSDLIMSWEFPILDTCLNNLEVTASFSGSGADSLIWTYPFGTSYSENLNFSITEAGQYPIILTAYDTLCNLSYNLSEVIEIDGTTQLNAFAAGDTICVDDDISLSGSTNGQNYSWSFPDGTNSSELSPNYTITQNGENLIWFYAELEGSCNGPDSTLITVIGWEPLSNSNWTITTQGQPCSGNTEVSGVYNGENQTGLIWDDGNGNLFDQNPVSFYYDVPGSYNLQLEVTNHICNENELFQYPVVVEEPVSTGPANLMPNIFSPNHDPLNPLWKTFLDLTTIEHWELKIFSRWGEVIFHSIDSSEGWDGLFHGGELPEGTFFFILEYSFSCDPERILQHSGYLYLVR